MDVNLVINKDATVSGSMIFAVADSLAEFGDSDTINNDPLKDSFNTKAEGVTESEYKSDGYTGIMYTFDRITFEEFNKGNSGDENEFKLIRDGNRLSIKGLIDFSQTDSEGANNDLSDLGDLGDKFAKSILSSFNMNISVKFPVRVLESTGKISDDGMTVSWKPKYGEKVDISTTVEIPSEFQLIYLIAILGLLGVGALIFLILRKSGKAETEIE
jgi:hypothetical protein